ncbi:MAG: hypothetical protein KJP23_24465 [Deltaproteobacteria bacterium]|nr:hypothetical protein [Deltaproteobacteria bacterium]
MYRLRILVLSVAVFFLTMPLQVLAAEEKHEEHKESHYHRNHVGLFLGNTHEEGEDEFTIGLDYEYRFSQYVGIGVLLEYVGEDDREGVGMVPLFLHPYKGFRWVVAAGVKPKADETKFIWRLGIGYRFPIGNWTIAPEFNLDFTEGKTVEVYGASFGYGF